MSLSWPGGFGHNPYPLQVRPSPLSASRNRRRFEGTLLSLVLEHVSLDMESIELYLYMCYSDDPGPSPKEGTVRPH